MTGDELRAMIEAYIIKTRENPTALARRAGLNEKGIYDILLGKSRNPRGDTQQKIIEAMTANGWLTPEGPPDDETTDDDFYKTNVVAAPDIPPLQPRLVKHHAVVPVMGTAEAGDDGFFELNLIEGPVEYIDLPPALQGLPQGELFAIRVHGESMEPLWEAGDPVYIVKSWPLKHRGYVVATIERGKGEHPRALLKQYISRSDDRVHLRQFNPAKEVELSRRQVKEMWRALSWRDLLDIR